MPADDSVTNSLPQLRAGNIKAYAVAASSRLAVAPDIPTTDEAGLPKFHLSHWHALWVPINRLSQIEFVL
jgi:tripartite-type tricarboxylate transporter receptor subunit TctC